MDGSPLLQGPVQGPGNGVPRSKPYNGRFSSRAGNFQRNNNSRQHRNGNGNFNHRNGYHGGFPKIRHSQMSNENLPPRPGSFSNPTFTMNGVTFNSHELHPSLFNPHYAFPAPPGPHPYAASPPFFNGPPFCGPLSYMGPHTPPDAFGPPPMDPAYLVCGQPHYPPPPGPYYPSGFVPNYGPVHPHPGMNGHPNGYFPPVGPVGPVGPVDHMGYGEPFPGHGGFAQSPPNIIDQRFGPHKVPSPVNQPHVKVNDVSDKKLVEQASENDTVGGVPLNPKTPEKAPRLIRVYHDDDEEEEDLKAASEKTATGNDIVVSVHEMSDNDSATEAESRSRSRSRTLSQYLRRSRSQSPSRSRSQSNSGSRSRSVSATGFRLGSSIDLAPLSDSENSKKTVIWSTKTPMEGSKPPSPSNSIASTNSSRTCASPTPKPDDAISRTLSIEEHVRHLDIDKALNLSEEQLQEVIQFIEDEMKKKAEKGETGSDCEER